MFLEDQNFGLGQVEKNHLKLKKPSKKLKKESKALLSRWNQFLSPANIKKDVDESRSASQDTYT